jgi:hypothetical protein
MMKKADPVIDKDFPYDVFIIDFGNAWIRTDEYSDSSIKVYGSPMNPGSYSWYYDLHPDFLKNYTSFITSQGLQLMMLEDEFRGFNRTPVPDCKKLLEHVVQFQMQQTQ